MFPWVHHDEATYAAAKFIRSRKHGFFVQIGSNDGVTGDPIYRHLAARDWRGVVVEPLPDIFERLKESYRDRPHVRAINAAVTASSGRMTIFRVDGRHPDDPFWADQLASFDRQTIMKHVWGVPNLSDRIKPVEVRTITWKNLISDISPPAIDFLHVDTEGHDYEVLRQIDWISPDAPTAVLFEHRHLTSIDIVSSQRMFEAAGYEFIQGGGDTFCRRSWN